MLKVIMLAALSLGMASPALALAPDSMTRKAPGKIILGKISAKALAKKTGINVDDAKRIIAAGKRKPITTLKALLAVPGLSKAGITTLKPLQFSFGKGTKSATSQASAKPELL